MALFQKATNGVLVSGKGILSSVLFAKYVHIVMTTIDDSIMGCLIGSLSMGILMSADDLVLISASVSKLQKS